MRAAERNAAFRDARNLEDEHSHQTQHGGHAHPMFHGPLEIVNGVLAQLP